MTLCCTRKILTATDGCWMLFKEHPQAVLGAVFNSRVYQVANYLHEKGRSWQDLWDMTFYTKIQSS